MTSAALRPYFVVAEQGVLLGHDHALTHLRRLREIQTRLSAGKTTRKQAIREAQLMLGFHEETDLTLRMQGRTSGSIRAIRRRAQRFDQMELWEKV